MYSGNNTTALQSRQWLVDALLSLMVDNKYSQITIKQVCQTADLSRQTFYNFFEQKDDILHFWISERYSIVLEKYELSKKLSLDDITVVFYDFIEANDNLLKCIISQGLEHIIAAEISNSIPVFASKVIDNIKKTNTCKYVNSFLSGALTQILICWFKDEQKLSKEDFSKLLLDLLSGKYV